MHIQIQPSYRYRPGQVISLALVYMHTLLRNLTGTYSNSAMWLCVCVLYKLLWPQRYAGISFSHHAPRQINSTQANPQLRYKVGARLEDVDSVKRSKPQKQMGMWWQPQWKTQPTTIHGLPKISSLNLMPPPSPPPPRPQNRFYSLTHSR